MKIPKSQGVPVGMATAAGLPLTPQQTGKVSRSLLGQFGGFLMAFAKGGWLFAKRSWPLLVCFVLVWLSTTPFRGLFHTPELPTEVPVKPEADQVIVPLNGSAQTWPRLVNESLIDARDSLHQPIQTILDPLGHNAVTKLLQGGSWPYAAGVIVVVALLAVGFKARARRQLGDGPITVARQFAVQVAFILGAGAVLAAPMAFQTNVQIAKVNLVRHAQLGYDSVQPRALDAHINKPAAAATLGAEGVNQGGTDYIGSLIAGQPVDKALDDRMKNFHATGWEAASVTAGSWAQATFDGLIQRFLITVAMVASAALTLLLNGIVIPLILLVSIVRERGDQAAPARRRRRRPVLVYVVTVAACGSILAVASLLASVEAWGSVWLTEKLGPHLAWLQALILGIALLIGLRALRPLLRALRRWRQSRRSQVVEDFLDPDDPIVNVLEDLVGQADPALQPAPAPPVKTRNKKRRRRDRTAEPPKPRRSVKFQTRSNVVRPQKRSAAPENPDDEIPSVVDGVVEP